MKALRRGLLSTLFGSALWLASSAALADGEPCINDIDCPGAECGGPVCNWSKPQGDKYTCNPAGTQTKGSDGWCTTDADCKCKGVGAVCHAPYCSFTKASDAPPATGGGGSGTAGTATTGGAGAATTAGTGGTGTTPTPAPAKDEGGCSIGSPASTGSGIALALGAIGLGVAFARRRR
jgi:MYXO-CTERM domain-containing protein